jgi:hypothetical protein
MKISQNFDVREFVPKLIWDQFKEKSTWFVNQKAVQLAEFYKSFFTTYYKNKLGNDKVKTVTVTINNWHIGGGKQWSGLRTAEFTEGGVRSQHRFMNAFDCELTIIFNDGKFQEVDYKEIHKVIKDNEAMFMANGLTCLEDVSDAPGWLHSDFRWIPNQTQILIVTKFL